MLPPCSGDSRASGPSFAPLGSQRPAMPLFLVAAMSFLVSGTAAMHDCSLGEPETWSPEKLTACLSRLENAEPRRTAQKAPSVPMRVLSPPRTTPAPPGTTPKVMTTNSSCAVNEVVQCPGSAPGVSCAGPQCCASGDTNFVCPSAPPGWNMCQQPKRSNCVRGSQDAPEEFKCDGLDTMWTWPEAQKKWCCSHKGVGCGAVGKQKPDGGASCHVLLIDWSMVPEEKKIWCCQHEGVGCLVKAECEKEYFAGEDGANSCPEDSKPLLESECHAMPGLFNLQAHNPLVIKTGDYPRGCFVFDTIFYFNEHPQGVGVHGRTPYCKTCKGKAPNIKDAKTLEYDCHKGYSNWWTTWSTWKKMWCCDREKMGCPPRGEQKDEGSIVPVGNNLKAVSATEGPSSEAGANQVGLATAAPLPTIPPTPPLPALPTLPPLHLPSFKMHTKARTTRPLQSTTAITRVAARTARTTTTPSPTTSRATTAMTVGKSTMPVHYACEDWKIWKWSLEKKEWCCKHKKAGCTVHDSKSVEDLTSDDGDDKHDCSLGNGLVWRWPEKKQKWCCKHFRVACPVTTTLPPTTTETEKPAKVPSTSLSNPLEEQVLGGGSPIDPSVLEEAPFLPSIQSPQEDCAQGDENRWTHQKKKFCCKTHKIGCQSTVDCLDDLMHMDHWSSFKKETCCKKFRIGCHNGNMVSKYQCTGPRETWSADKHSWCCQHRQLDCSNHDNRTPLFTPAFLQRFQQSWHWDRYFNTWWYTVPVACMGLGFALVVLKVARQRVRTPAQPASSYDALLENGLSSHITVEE